MKVAGTVALITGAACGFGKEISLYLLKNGGKVFAVDLNKKLGEQFEKDCTEQFGNGSIKFMQCDVSDSKQLKNAFEESVKTFKSVNIICNNAGIAGKLHRSYIDDFENNDIRKLIDIDLTAVIEGTYLGLNLMSKKNGQNGGLIVNVASAAGLRVAVFSPVYTAAKHGVTSFTHTFKYLKNHAEDGVRVNCLCPSFVDTAIFETNPAFREAMMKKTAFAEISDVVKAFAQCVEDETLNGDAIAVLPHNTIKKVELTPPNSKI